MHKALTLAAITLLFASSANAQTQSKRSEKGEADLAKALEGRVAGKPVDCINLRDIDSSQIYGGTAIVYQVHNVLYVNRPSGASFLHRDDILVTDTHSSQLCNIDIVRLLDSASRFPTGSVGLGDFVPYTKVKDVKGKG